MSHSLQLSSMLHNEKTLFKEEMNQYLETKLNDLLTIVKTNVSETIDTKLSDFYTKTTSVDYDAILFDIDGSTIITECLAFLKDQQARASTVWSKEDLLQNTHMIAKLSNITDTRCFALGHSINGDGKYIICVYKDIMIEKYVPQNYVPFSSIIIFRTIKHVLSNDVLFAFKHMQLGVVRVFDDGTQITALNPCTIDCRPPVPKDSRFHDPCTAHLFDPSIHGRMHTYKKHPEYFRQQGNEFERFCKKEYEEIEHVKHEYEEKLATLEADREYFRQYCVRTEDTFKTKREELDRMKAELDMEMEECLRTERNLRKETHKFESCNKEAIENIHQIVDDLEKQTRSLKNIMSSRHKLNAVKRDPLEPYKPWSASHVYVDAHFDSFGKANPQIPILQRIGELHHKWETEVTEAEKLEYNRKSNLLWKQYYKDMEEFIATLPDTTEASKYFARYHEGEEDEDEEDEDEP
jgi:hypothetical protein